jgi:hypothetical protein
MPLVKIPAIKAPTVSLYIRITDEKGRRYYERVRPRSPQPCGPRDNYALLYYVPKMTWEQVGQDYNEAVRRRAAKAYELLLAAREQRERTAQADTTRKGPSSLEELRSAFLAMKRKEKRKDRTPLDPDTIRSHEQLTADFIHLTKCQYPGDITGEKLNDWMLTLDDGYTGKDGNGSRSCRRSGRRSAPGRNGVHPGKYLGRCKERGKRNRQCGVRIFSARL